ncbi:CDP-glycerol glycerophosphotransferase family protein [Allobacillus sp. GCM10007489]|uniref:bifunctional glycosyltransferase/CDP-glycerol:glycerophosphate glycerophosphotransferase n=1 Tax=unclassified Allobacillus TaxID=2628859 RepID=UPI0016430AE2|nr:CDP-glycerol glycerophosphotransferase family protein [Allobacillus sp. SKP2-8]
MDISVIIPVHNAPIYIEEAINSVNKQNFFGDVEIIVIDDCSTDNTVSSIKRIMKSSRFPIKLIELEQNMKQGAARNKGLSIAKGKYVFFLDSDDFIHEDCLNDLFEEGELFDHDFVMCDWAYSYEDRGIVYANFDSFLREKRLYEKDCERLLEAITFFTVNKLYNKDFLQKNHISYGEGYIYEDYEFYVNTTINARSIGVISNPYYFVRFHDNSTTKISRKTTIHIDSFVRAVEATLLDFEPRKEISYYHLYKHLLRKALNYSNNRAPFGKKIPTIKKVIKLLNNKKVDYIVPKNIVLHNHLYFRRAYVQRGQILKILIVDWLHRKKKLNKVFYKYKAFRDRVKAKNKREAKANVIKESLNNPVKKGRILFLGFDFKYKGNSKYLFDYLTKQAHPYQIFIATKNKSVPGYLRVKPRSLKFYEYLYSSEIVIAESWIPLDFRKREDSKWIQLWHGTPFKKLLFDSNEKNILTKNKLHKRNKQRDIRRWDYLIADSEFAKQKLSKSFLFNPENIMTTGYPRVQWLKDNIVNTNLIEELKAELNIPINKKVILYTPTWRDYNHKTKLTDFNFKLDLGELANKLSDEYVIIDKSHDFEKNWENVYNEVIQPNNTFETQELILISDIIISDYSSIIFDAMHINKPFYLYINDLYKYQDSRGVYQEILDHLQPLITADKNKLMYMIENNIYGNLNLDLSKFIDNNYQNSNEVLKEQIESLISR